MNRMIHTARRTAHTATVVPAGRLAATVAVLVAAMGAVAVEQGMTPWGDRAAAAVAKDDPWTSVRAGAVLKDDPWTSAPAGASKDDPWTAAPAGASKDDPWT
ncbi:hypothetical protein [Streptomyces sp. NPDC090022]|uniref:hypothetical protein n=1 Tax=Streptomyces sp. NPDC090022 TaxID=3365920 RepID=UPI0038230063